ncbi:MAG: hypothetical protein K6F50_00845 [Kiritimatiellae bacterium]|nr:hypothetical protein [Kiritimatiellia bacterium]
MTTRVKAFSGALALALIPFISAKADATYYWTGGGDDTNFDTTANWGSDTGTAYPVAGDGATFQTGAADKTVTFNGSYAPSWVWVATGDTESPVTWAATDSANGMTSAGNITIADSADQVGALKITSGTYVATGEFLLGYGSGALTMEGGSLSSTGAATWGWAADSTTSVQLNGGTLSINGAYANDAGNIALNALAGAGGKLYIGVNNATFQLPAGDAILGAYGAWAADYTDSIVTGYVTVDVANGGSFICGSDTDPHKILLGQYGSEPMTVNLNAGGTLGAGRITRGAANGTSAVNFNGGTLEVIGDYNDGTAFLPDSGIVYTVGTQGGTLDTNGKSITIDATIAGEGTLDIVGGGSVTFSVAPTCSVTSSDNTTYEIPTTGTYYWVGGAVGDNPRVAFSATAGKWSATKGGEAIADFVPGEGDTAVFATTDGAVYLYPDNVAADVKAEDEAQVVFFVYNSADNITMTSDIDIASGATVTLRAIRNTISFAGKLTGSGTLIANSTAMNTWVRLIGDTSSFEGLVEFVATGHSYGVCRIADAAAAGNALSAWNIYTTHDSIIPYRTDKTIGYTAFDLGNGKTYTFGSLNAAVAPYGSYFTGCTFNIGGRDTEDSSFYGQFQGSGNAITWSAPTTFTYGVTNAASFTVTGGGTVKFVDSGALPTAFTVSGTGAYIGMTTDSDVNAAGVAAITSIASGATIGFDADDTENECAVNISSASILEGQTLVKKGAGVLYMSGITYTNDIVVNEGALVLAHGSVVGDVTVASGASLLVDLSGAADAEEVFTYTSISGDGTVSYRNKSDRATVTTDVSPWVLTMSGEAITYTWSGLGNDNDWSNVANWYADGTDATELPTAGDTVNIDREGVVILSAPEEITANVVVKSGYTLTISSGFVFSSLTVEDGGYIAFNGAIAAVGDSMTLTATVADFTASNFANASNGNYEVSLSEGVLTATRIAATYTWTGAADTNWATSGNWTVGETAVAEVPETADSVIFPASDAEDFTGWSVALAADVSVQGVAVNGNVALSGGKTIRTLAISGSAELHLNTANIGTLGAALTVSCPVNILAGSTDYIYLAGYNAQLDGALIGSGTLISDANGVQNIGVTFNGDVSEFAGKFQSTKYNNRDHTNFGSGVYGSTNAVWEISPSDSKDYNSYVINSSDATYMFGALIGDCWAGNYYGKVQIGGRDDVDSSVTLHSHTTSQGDPRAYTITKIGNSTLTINNAYNSEKLATLYLNGGTAVLGCYPTSTLTFGGGIVKTPAYTTTVDDVETTVYPDISGKITDSTGPIAFTNDEGEEHVWATELAASNKGGLSKYGDGTLTLSAAPLYFGLTSVMGGTLVVPEDDKDCFTEIYHDDIAGKYVIKHPVNALSTGNLIHYSSDASVTNYCDIGLYAYPAGTTLYGTEEADDYLTADLDFSGVATVDVSAKDLYDEENNKFNNVVLARTTGAITGIGKVGDGLTLTVPDCPDGVSAQKWQWTVRTTVETVGDVTYHCVTVTPKILPFVISIQ